MIHGAAMSPRRKRLILTTIGSFLACAVGPGTGPLVRHTLSVGEQSVAQWFCDSGNFDEDDVKRLHAFHVRVEADRAAADRTPDDFPVQLAACERRVPDASLAFLQAGGDAQNAAQTAPFRPEETEYNEQVAHELMGLGRRFERNPSFHAAVLRYLSFHAVRLGNRHDDEILFSKPFDVQREPAPFPENLRAWHQSAQSGERLEPQNAFFPFMDAVAFFDENRDTAALAALHRAGAKSGYNDHVTDAAAGYLRLQEAEGRDQTALCRLVAMEMQTYPHYSLLRNLARVAVAKAVGAELQNRTGDGFSIRRDVRRIGTNLRLHSPSWVGSVVGSSIALTSERRPGGAFLVSDELQTDAADAPAHRYEAYLRRVGHGKEADAFAVEVAAQADNHRLLEQVQNHPAFILNLPRLAGMVLVLTSSLLLLTNALFLIMVGGMAALVGTRMRSVKRGLPLPRAVRAGIGSAVWLPTGASLVWWGVPAFWEWAGAGLFLSFTGAAAAVVGLVYWLCFARHNQRIHWRLPAVGAKAIFGAVFLWTGGVLGVGAAAAILGFAAFLFGRAAWSVVGGLGLMTSDVDNGNTHRSECFLL